MAMRHQIFVFYHKDDKEKPTWVGFHNQWCYGTLPLRHVIRLSQFQSRASKHSVISNTFDDETEKIKAILSLDLTKGTYHACSCITKELSNKKGGPDPDRGDNNEGITVIYIPRKTRIVQYCFMFLEPLKNADGTIALPAKTPLTAEQYVTSYYPQGRPQWENYKIRSLVKYINKNCLLLTLEEYKELFPTWYEPDPELVQILKASKTDLPLFINCAPYNRVAYEQRLKELI